jgi:hypothetical protein
MNKRIKELAEQAGLHIANNREGRALVFGNQAHVHVLFDELERFAELVRQDERDACAKLCDETTNLGWFAKEIRARSEK